MGPCKAVGRLVGSPTAMVLASPHVRFWNITFHISRARHKGHTLQYEKSLEEFIVVLLYFQHVTDDVKKIELHGMTCGSIFFSMLNLRLTMTSQGHCILLSGRDGVGWGLQCLETSWLQFQTFPSCLF